MCVHMSVHVGVVTGCVCGEGGRYMYVWEGKELFYSLKVITFRNLSSSSASRAQDPSAVGGQRRKYT